jgi:hypothetical protein
LASKRDQAGQRGSTLQANAGPGFLGGQPRASGLLALPSSLTTDTTWLEPF